MMSAGDVLVFLISSLCSLVRVNDLKIEPPSKRAFLISPDSYDWNASNKPRPAS
jgi:hypothetical protein